jgi:hypothetical protein
MSDDRERFHKILALAVNPGAVEGEAIAALNRMRELVRQNPSLAHPPPAAAEVQTKPAPPQPALASYETKITSVHPDWVLIVVGLLSKRAYELELKSRFQFDFSQSLTAIEIFCSGSEIACESFQGEVRWCVNYVNDKLKTPQ